MRVQQTTEKCYRVNAENTFQILNIYFCIREDLKIQKRSRSTVGSLNLQNTNNYVIWQSCSETKRSLSYLSLDFRIFFPNFFLGKSLYVVSQFVLGSWCFLNRHLCCFQCILRRSVCFYSYQFASYSLEEFVSTSSRCTHSIVELALKYNASGNERYVKLTVHCG